MLFSLSVMYNCIYILPFLWPEDASRRNFASSTCSFHNLQILPSKILHPQLALSMPCRYFPQKFGIFNPQKSTIADIVAQHPLLLFTSQLEPIHYLQKNWYKKFERIWNGRWRHLERKFLLKAKIYVLMCHPLMESEQEFLYQFFVRNVLPLRELNSNSTYFCP